MKGIASNFGITITDDREIPETTRTLLQHAGSNYSFIIPHGETCTLSEFADLIEQHYDTDNPQNRAVVEALRS